MRYYFTYDLVRVDSENNRVPVHQGWNKKGDITAVDKDSFAFFLRKRPRVLFCF